jgi:hypothetical protein
MKKLSFVLLLVILLSSACVRSTPLPGPTETPMANTTATAETTATQTLVPAASYPPEGYGPGGFPTDVDPLTGLKVADPALLERRPILVKVSNLPRSVRPQWGLSLADIVFEYYTEAGSSRFAAIFLGNDAEMVGPIRSGRFFDDNLVRGYKAVFAFGSAYVVEMDRFLSSDYAGRLVIQGPNSPLFRYDPNNLNYLMANITDVSASITTRGVSNGRQDLDGMTFKMQAPENGEPGSQMIVRYSGSIYNRWDYDPSSGKYLRYSDTLDDFDIQNEQYAQLTDRLTGQPITADNVVVVFTEHDIFYTDHEGNNIYDILFTGTGKAVLFRDGQAFRVRWRRDASNVVSLTDTEGNPIAFKPGITWFEVVGAGSTDQQNDQGWRFTHIMP